MESWAHLINMYLSDMLLHGGKRETATCYKTHLKRFLKALEDKPKYCSSVTVKNSVKKVLIMNPTSYRGHGSKRLLNSVIQSFLHWCMHNGSIPYFDLAYCFSPSKGKGERTVPFTYQELKRFFQAIRESESHVSQRDEALFAIYAFTGIRRSEPLSLRFLDYDGANRIIRVRNKGGSFKLKPVIEKLRLILDDYCNTVIEMQKSQIKNPYLFSGRSHDHLSSRQANNIFNKWKKQAGLRDELTIHSFRAGFATNLYIETKDIFLVKNALDHKDIKTTESYVGFSANMLEMVEKTFGKPNFINEITL